MDRIALRIVEHAFDALLPAGKCERLYRAIGRAVPSFRVADHLVRAFPHGDRRDNEARDEEQDQHEQPDDERTHDRGAHDALPFAYMRDSIDLVKYRTPPCQAVVECSNQRQEGAHRK